MMSKFIIIFGVISTSLISFVTAEYFSSVSSMEHLVESEKFLLDTLEYFVVEEEKLLSDLKSKLISLKSKHKSDNQSTIEYLSNPLNEYLLIKRLYMDWSTINNELAVGPGHQFLYNYQYLVDNKLLPSGYDIGGAAEAMFRLQATYNIDAKSFASGKFDGVQVNTSMSARDCFDLGYQAYEGGNYEKSSEWLNESYRLSLIEDHDTAVNWIDLMEALSRSLFHIGNVEEAYAISKALLERFPYHERANIDLRKYEKILFNENDEDNDVEEVQEDPYMYNEQEFQRYVKVCRGELTQSLKEQAKLKCYYEFNTSPYLKIGGVKVEEVNLHPQVVVFHDVLFKSEIDQMINVSKDIIKRSEVVGESYGESLVGEYRVSQNTGIRADDYSFLSKVDERIEAITGLSTLSSEGHQVANYGIGGHYEPHLDFTSKFGDPPLDMYEIDGNRIATLVFYLTDVIKGGSTAFPYLNVRVMAKKGSALFWHNLFKDGEGNYLTRHAACPVLFGNKWSNNVWLRERGQEFKRPCELQPDHDSDDVWISRLGQ